MSKGSIATSALVILATGGYLGYQQWGPKPKPAAPYAPKASTGSGSSAGSSGSGSAAGSSESGSSAGSSETEAKPSEVKEVEVPDLVGLTPDQARKRLAEVGFAPTALELPRDVICRYDDDKDMAKQGTICSQARSPGTRIMSNAKVRVAIENDTYEEGGLETGQAWRRMPDVTGKPLDQALEILRDKGFGATEFEVEARGACTKGTVCESNPEAGMRKFATSPGTLTTGA